MNDSQLAAQSRLGLALGVVVLVVIFGGIALLFMASSRRAAMIRMSNAQPPASEACQPAKRYEPAYLPAGLIQKGENRFPEGQGPQWQKWWASDDGAVRFVVMAGISGDFGDVPLDIVQILGHDAALVEEGRDGLAASWYDDQICAQYLLSASGMSRREFMRVADSLRVP